jgi:hypothetical protein
MFEERRGEKKSVYEEEETQAGEEYRKVMWNIIIISHKIHH